jgi:hypothetical protein
MQCQTIEYESRNIELNEPLLNEPLLNEPLLNEPLLNEPLSRQNSDTCFPAGNLGVSLWRLIEETIDKMDALNYKNRVKCKSPSSPVIRTEKRKISSGKKTPIDMVSLREKWTINRSGVRISDVSELINHLDKTLNKLVLAQTDKICDQDFKEDICFYIISKIENPHIIIVLNQLQLVMENVDHIGMYKCFVTKFANDQPMLEKWGEAFVKSENAQSNKKWWDSVQAELPSRVEKPIRKEITSFKDPLFN